MEILKALADSSWSVFLRTAPWPFPALMILHILSFSILIGSALSWDLRLLGLWRDIPLLYFYKTCLTLARIGFAGAALFGLLLFASNPAELAENKSFQIKLVLIVLAVGNTVVFHRRFPDVETTTDVDGQLLSTVRIHGILSLVLWSCVVIAGRLISYG